MYVYVAVFDQTLQCTLYNAFSDLEGQDDCLLDKHQTSEGEIESDFPGETFLFRPKSQVASISRIMQDAKTSLRASLKALGLLEGATQSEIREAYLRLTKVRLLCI